MSLADLIVNADQPIATSDWVDITQERIDRFADVTGDSQWIHTDPGRATHSPFGTTIAHGFLTLALISQMLANAMTFSGTAMVVNYGLNRVRFVTPVPTGSRIRAHFAVADLTPCSGGVQVTWTITIEREGTLKPACVADWVVRYYEPNA